MDAAFLADICASPADDTPRLVYADWLNENGQGERAEFIRVQVELAKARAVVEVVEGGFLFYAGRRFDGPAVIEEGAGRDLLPLRLRARELLKAHEDGWLEGLLPGLELLNLLDDDERGPGAEWWDGKARLETHHAWRRGFVAEVSLTLADWLAHGPALVRAAPLERVRLSDREPQDYHNNVPVLNRGRLYGWYRALDVPAELLPHTLPNKLWTLVARAAGCQRHGRWADFRTPEGAVDALSVACIDWAWAQPVSSATAAQTQ
jgi:uncharacterized protein (TIGR02996 family)